MRLVELDTSGKWLRETSLVSASGTKTWILKNIPLRTGNATAYVYVHAGFTKGYGTFRVDNIELQKIAVDTPALTSTPTGGHYCISCHDQSDPEPTPAPTPSPTPSPPVISSGDGLKLSLGENGTIEGISINDTMLPMLTSQGGFSFREVLTSPPNLIANSGFESGAATPLNWSFVTSNGSTPVWDTISNSGARSIKISIPGTTNNRSGYPKSDLMEAELLAY